MLTAGQRFLDAASYRIDEHATDPALVDRYGKAIDREQIGERVLSLESVDERASPHILTFSIAGIGSAVMRSDADVTRLQRRESDRRRVATSGANEILRRVV